MNSPYNNFNISRRRLLAQGTIGATALSALLNPSATYSGEQVNGAESSVPQHPALASKGTIANLHLPQRAKRVIWLTMAGGPSHLELFDYKPKLAEMHGQPMPESFTKGQQLAQLQGQELRCLGPLFGFKPYGSQGTQIGELLPHLGNQIDNLCLIRSMTTDAINHDPAHMFMNTGSQISGRPSMGAWIHYGLGSMAENLPGFVVLVSTGKGRSPQPIAARQWSSGFLPSRHQGVQLRSRGEPVLYLNNPPGIDREQQSDDIAAINAMNRQFAQNHFDPEIETRIAQYELAFEMQTSIPNLMDTQDETQETLSLYGCEPGDGTFASNCLLARRLAQRGVRFIQLYHRDWDHHSLLKEELPLRAKEVDQASAALLQDLHRLGMLEETLVVWTGEFGRTPMSQQNKGPIGRDHHNKSMSMWLAGGGIRPGTVYGATDELGYAAVENICTVHDLHATMLHQLGIDHNAFTYKFQGLDFKLTGVEGANVIRDIIA
jgi:hypothetical protein